MFWAAQGRRKCDEAVAVLKQHKKAMRLLLPLSCTLVSI